MNSRSFPSEPFEVHVTAPGNSAVRSARAERMDRSSLVYVPDRTSVYTFRVRLESKNGNILKNRAYSHVYSFIEVDHYAVFVQDRDCANSTL